MNDSSPAWPEPNRARKGAPNVLFWIIDDVGYGQMSAFGGLVNTPNIDRLANNGLRYTNMHTTALCSPTRACMLTGRNHHSNGLAAITEFATGYPGYDGRMPFENGMLSEILLEKGYNTFCTGKWHLNPTEEGTPAGPYHRWPLGRGFERFYGFLGGETNQWFPDLTYDNHSVPQPKSVEEGYHLYRRPLRQGHSVHPRCARQRARQALLPLSRHRGRACAAPGGSRVDRQVQGQVRHGLGQVPRDRLRESEKAGHPPGEHRTLAPRP